MCLCKVALFLARGNNFDGMSFLTLPFADIDDGKKIQMRCV